MSDPVRSRLSSGRTVHLRQASHHTTGVLYRAAVCGTSPAWHDPDPWGGDAGPDWPLCARCARIVAARSATCALEPAP